MQDNMNFAINNIFCFRMDDAVKYGTDGAIFINYIRLWLGFNRDKHNNFKDGKFWTYDTMQTLAEKFPCWSEKQIRRITSNLEKHGVIQTGNYNKKGYDRTKWYTFTDAFYPEEYRINEEKPNEIKQLPKRANAFAQTGGPIPSNNIIYRENNEAERSEESDNNSRPGETQIFLDYWKSKGLNYPKTIAAEMALMPKVKQRLEKTKTPLQALIKAIDNYQEVKADETISYAYKDVSAPKFLSLKANGECFYEQFLEGIYTKGNFGTYKNFNANTPRRKTEKGEIQKKIDTINKLKDQLNDCSDFMRKRRIEEIGRLEREVKELKELKELL